MPDYVHTSTLALYRSQWPQPGGTVEISRAQYDAALAIAPQYRQWTGTAIVELGEAERAAVDAAARIVDRDAAVAQIDRSEDILRALAQALIGELNAIRSPAYGGLYVDSVQPTQVVSHNSVTAIDALTGSDAMASHGLTVDANGGRLILPAAGDYLITWQLSFSGTANTTFNVAAYGGASTEVNGTRATRRLGAGGDVVSVSGGGLVTTPAADVPVNLRAVHSEGNDRDVTVHALQIMVTAMPATQQRTLAQLRAAIRAELGT